MVINPCVVFHKSVWLVVMWCYKMLEMSVKRGFTVDDLCSLMVNFLVFHLQVKVPLIVLFC